MLKRVIVLFKIEVYRMRKSQEILSAAYLNTVRIR